VLIGIGETGRGGNGMIGVQTNSEFVADLVQRRDLFLHESRGFFQQVANDRRVDVEISGQLQNAIQAAHAVQNEVDVGERGAVVGHNVRLRRGSRR